MERLHKFLAHAGIGSRRECEDLVREGRVTVDGEVVRAMGILVDPVRQRVKVDGVLVRTRPPVYFLLHKPKGYVCTSAEGERGRRAIDLAPRGAGPLHTVGRLDRESEGLVILTNDGALTERLTHPRFEVPKIYRVLAKGRVGPEAIAKLKKGIWLAEGKARASAVRLLRVSRTATLFDIELKEGMNREIRRMLAKLGHKVKKLVRVAIGPLRIEGLAPGTVRPLARAEIEALFRAPAPPKRAESPPGNMQGKAAFPPQPRGAGRAGEAPASPARQPSPEPPPCYEPDEEGVIVVRRPPVRFSEEE
jgi:23S rRNA pseudouridine2605 synthase